MSVNKQAYYEYRAGQARGLAAAATDPRVAAIHSEMADRYDALATEHRPPAALYVVETEQERRSGSA